MMEGRLEMGFVSGLVVCRNKFFGRKEMKVSQSESKLGKSKGKGAKSSKNSKIVISKKNPTVFKKIMSPYFVEKEQLTSKIYILSYR